MAFGSEQLVYFSDRPTSSEILSEPPFDLTRELIQTPVYYVNIRYPYETEDLDEPGVKFLSMLLSLGHEYGEMIFFQIKKLAILKDGEPLPISVSFLNQDTGEEDSSYESLLQYLHRVPSHEHRRVRVSCYDGYLKQDNLVIEIELDVRYSDKQESIHKQIALYRGYYQRRQPF